MEDRFRCDRNAVFQVGEPVASGESHLAIPDDADRVTGGGSIDVCENAVDCCRWDGMWSVGGRRSVARDEAYDYCAGEKDEPHRSRFDLQFALRTSNRHSPDEPELRRKIPHF